MSEIIFGSKTAMFLTMLSCIGILCIIVGLIGGLIEERRMRKINIKRINTLLKEIATTIKFVGVERDGKGDIVSVTVYDLFTESVISINLNTTLQQMFVEINSRREKSDYNLF